MLPGCGVANKHRQTVTAIDLALKRLESDAICRKCMEQRARRTQTVAVSVITNGYRLTEGDLWGPPTPDSALVNLHSLQDCKREKLVGVRRFELPAPASRRHVGIQKLLFLTGILETPADVNT